MLKLEPPFIISIWQSRCLYSGIKYHLSDKIFVCVKISIKMEANSASRLPNYFMPKICLSRSFCSIFSSSRKPAGIFLKPTINCKYVIREYNMFALLSSLIINFITARFFFIQIRSRSANVFSNCYSFFSCSTLISRLHIQGQDFTKI